MTIKKFVNNNQDVKMRLSVLPPLPGRAQVIIRLEKKELELDQDVVERIRKWQGARLRWRFCSAALRCDFKVQMFILVTS
jgi:hypothetical protein